jgi:hypothetical protein
VAVRNPKKRQTESSISKEEGGYPVFEAAFDPTHRKEQAIPRERGRKKRASPANRMAVYKPRKAATGASKNGVT